MIANNVLMNAVRIHGFGGPEQLVYEPAPRPRPKRGEVLIRVHAAGVNPVDWKTRQGEGVAGYIHGTGAILGWDVSGTVAALGPGTDAFRIGDEVFGMLRFPHPGSAYAEYATAPVTQIALKPKSLDHVHAAAVPLPALTAWQALFTVAGLKAGQRILIHGAAGGVGHLAVQLAKWKGAQVVGTTSARNAAFLRSLGAESFDYTAAPFEKNLSGFDVVFDTVGGDAAERSFPILRKGGILVSILDKGNEVLAHKFGVRSVSMRVKTDGNGLAEIAGLIDAGALRPTVETVLALNEVRRAHELSQGGRVRGKIVLRVAGGEHAQ